MNSSRNTPGQDRLEYGLLRCWTEASQVSKPGYVQLRFVGGGGGGGSQIIIGVRDVLIRGKGNEKCQIRSRGFVGRIIGKV